MPRSLLWPDSRVKPPFGSVELDQGHALARGLVALWLFNEGGGGPKDLVGVNHGTPNGGVNWVSGRTGPALNFDGVNDAVHTTSFTLPDTFSVSAWVNVNSQSSDYRRIVETAYNAGFYLGLDTTADPGFKWIVNNNIIPYGTAEGGTLTFGQWTHVIGTYNGTTGILYVNGVQVGTDTFTNPGSRTDTVDIGANASNGSALKGLIDEVRIYNRALSAGEVLESYLEPYAMLRPIVRRRYFVPAAVTIAAEGAHGAMYPRMQRHIHQSWTVPRIG